MAGAMPFCEATGLLPQDEEAAAHSESDLEEAAAGVSSRPSGRVSLASFTAAALLLVGAAAAWWGRLPGHAPAYTAATAQTLLAEAHLDNTTAPANCSAVGENCNVTQCCQDASLHCFAKADYWATCEGSCIAGVHTEDGPQYQQPWACNLVGSKSVPLTTLHWNVHWQCSRARDGSSGACRARAARRLVELASKTGAHVVAAIELADDAGTPVDLRYAGLKGWTQVDGKCANINPDLWDSLSLTFAPGWTILDSGGGCLNGRADTRAFAVARARPPRPVRRCPELCILALHAPHMTILEGRATVARVCGAAADHCAVAVGDWNVPLAGGIHGGVANRWSELVGGTPPNFLLPNWRTCCYPEWRYHGFYDHIATNIPGAHTEGKNGSTGYRVFPYQILEDNPVEEHKPLSVWMQLPAA